MRTQMPRCIQLGSMHACMRGKGLVDANARKWALGAARHLEMTGREPGCVEGFVWIGAMVHVCDVRLLRRLGVTHVLSVCEQMVDVPGDMVYEWYKTEDVCTFDISKHFEKAVRFLRDVRRRGGVVLVHCYAGSSRSVAIVAAYMVWCGWDLQAALREIRGVREAACPNEGFLERLAEWEREIGRRRDEEVEMCGSTRLDIPCVKRGRDPILQGMSPVTPDETPSLFSTNVPTSAYIACQKRL